MDTQQVLYIITFSLTIIGVVSGFLWKINDIRVDQSKVTSLNEKNFAVLENKLQNTDARIQDILKNYESLKKETLEQSKEFNSVISDLKKLLNENNKAIDKISMAIEHLIEERKEMKEIIYNIVNKK